MSAGHIRSRGKQSWELKFDAGRDPATGKRKIQYHSFKGAKRAAQVKLAEMIAAVGRGTYVEPSRIMVGDYVRARIDQWESAGTISARTAQRYRQLLDGQIAPHLGAMPLQKLKPLDIEAWHTVLRTDGRKRGKGGVSARTIGHAHRVLSKALREAEKNELVTRNVAKIEAAPKVDAEEMIILVDGEAETLLDGLQSSPLLPLAAAALYTGMRLGEVLAMRWRGVDLDDGKLIQVREALEETTAHGIRFKAPKTKAGRRDISLPDVVIKALHQHRRQQLELRMKLGMGKRPSDALVFPDLEGGPRRPSAVSREWGLAAAALDMPHVTFHALRHTHASQLIDAGVDVVTISRRLGHSNPTVTLQIYAHLFRKDDSKAADAINAALTAPARS